MPDDPQLDRNHATAPARTVTRALLSAALSGLLGAATTACGTSASDATAGTALGCPHETGGVVVASTTDATMTYDKFVALCDARKGTLEFIVECGGRASCKGVAWDQTAQTVTEHTCKGVNTCAGYNCVDPC